MVRAIGFCPDQPIVIVLSKCFVSRPSMEIVHTIGSCCDLPTEIVFVPMICFWSRLLIGIVRSIGFCPDVSNASLRFHLL